MSDQKRNHLTKLFDIYKECNVEMVNEVGHFCPTLYFVFKKKNTKLSEREFFPVSRKTFPTDKELEIALTLMVIKIDPSEYELELIMYAQEAESEDGEEIVYGAQDCDGYLIHSFSKSKIPTADKWTKGEGNDEFLDIVTKKYLIARSINSIFT